MAREKLSVTINGARHELFMSFGLLNRLTDIVGRTSSLSTAALDSEDREKILKLVLEKRGKSGAIEAPVVLDDVDISVDEVMRVLEWVSEHCIGFFIRATEQTKLLGDKFAARLENLMPSPDGTSPSASMTPSAGPSA
jgi:hypothetical protein